ncbi:alpha/beta fold hydrolase [Antrihabitans stalactiti]|uniref:Alpha/beta hydrolase n=1 Tax=Antrihabitans stalactiti TaxID=2584121 RepID=A0A848KDT1_9NOCA|nr:alpha/beta hydrolase [Antrihabitans stalactiti]NMN96391.1 alpha/beta hydrolase [Antrihabitans stalactiti]
MSTIDRNGVTLAYEDVGVGAPPMLFVHGAYCTRADFVSLVAHYRPQHRVIAVDLRGHGESDTPDQVYSVSAFADDLAWLCAQLGVHRPIVVGHSLGGQVALQLAADHPELPAAIVALDSTIAPPDGTGDMLQPFTDAMTTPGYLEALHQFMAVTVLPTDTRTHAAGVLDRMNTVPQHVVASTWINGLVGWDSAPAASACRVPFLYIDHGAPNCDLARLAELCPQLTVDRTDGVGHWALLEAPDQVMSIVDRFLEATIDQGVPR